MRDSEIFNQFNDLKKIIVHIQNKISTLDLAQDALLTLMLGNRAKRFIARILFGISQKKLRAQFWILHGERLKAAQKAAQEAAEKVESKKKVKKKIRTQKVRKNKQMGRGQR